MDEAQVWSRADRSRVGGRVADEEECSKRLILGSGFKTADLVRESKRRFGLVVRLIANECYEDTFYFLSFLPTVLRLPSSASHICLIASSLDDRGSVSRSRVTTLQIALG